nr:hypothetical protein Iba_chr03aCG4880 [Ipomoea batatas]
MPGSSSVNPPRVISLHDINFRYHSNEIFSAIRNEINDFTLFPLASSLAMITKDFEVFPGFPFPLRFPYGLPSSTKLMVEPEAPINLPPPFFLLSFCLIPSSTYRWEPSCSMGRNEELHLLLPSAKTHAFKVFQLRDVDSKVKEPRVHHFSETGN